MFKLADKKDIPPGKSLVVNLPNGSQIALFNINGQIYALDNACPHMGGPLGEGDVDGCIVTCPWHAWQFDIKTGENVNMQGEDAHSIPIEIHGEGIFLADS